MSKLGVCYVFGAAPIDDISYIQKKKQPNDLIICADGGYQTLKRLHLEPDIIIGDFDSGEKPLDRFVIEYPSKKDETDMFLAVRTGLAQGYNKYKLYGGLGGRFDHTLANVQLLIYLSMHDAIGVLYDRTNEVRVLCDYGTIKLSSKPDYKVSLLSLTDQCTGVTTKGLEYTLCDAILTNDFPLGVSNVFTEDIAEISITGGKLLVILSKD